MKVYVVRFEDVIIGVYSTAEKLCEGILVCFDRYGYFPQIEALRVDVTL